MPRHRGRELAACPIEPLGRHRMTGDPSGGVASLDAVLARHREPVVPHQSVDVRDRATADQGDRAPGRATQHGIERRDAAGRISRHAVPAQGLDWARSQLAAAVARHHGLVLEDKGLSLALHYRRAPRLGSYAHRLIRSLAGRIGSQYCVQTGKRIVEMKPAGKDKGVAVLEFMQEEPFRGRTPVFIGDDTTDEYGFATVNRLHGHSVKVGPGRTVAHWRLRDVDAVRAWLAQRPEEDVP